jgi:hypothetical protein
MHNRIEIILICLDRLWNPLHVTMKRFTFVILAPALIFESASRLEAENKLGSPTLVRPSFSWSRIVELIRVGHRSKGDLKGYKK